MTAPPRPRPCPPSPSHGRARGPPGWPCPAPSTSSRSWPSGTASASGRSRCAAPTWTPARPRSSTCPAAPPWKTSARRAPSAPGGYGRCRSAKAGTAPTNRDPGPDPATDEQQALIVAAGALRVRPRRRRTRAAEWDQVADARRRASPKSKQAIAAEGLRGRVAPPHADRRRRGRRRRPAAPRSGPPGAGRTCPTCPGRRSSRAPSAAPTPAADGTHVPAVDVAHPHPRLLRPGPLHPPAPTVPCRRGTPTTTRCSAPRSTRQLRLPAGRLGRRPLPPAARPVLAEPAPGGRLERPVRRLRRAATPPRPARALRHPGHHPPRAAANRSPPPPTTRCGGRPPTSRVYTADRPPVWDADAGRLGRPGHRRAAADLGDALDALDDDPDAEPAHVVRFGAQVDAKGVDPGSQGRRTDDRLHHQVPHQGTPPTATPPTSDPQRAHLDRLWRELRVTPVLRAVRELAALRRPAQERPRQAAPRPLQGPGPPDAPPSASAAAASSSPATGPARPSPTTAPTRRAWVRALLGVTVDTTTPTRPTTEPADRRRYAWELARPDDPDVPPLEHRLLRAISERIRWRQPTPRRHPRRPTRCFGNRGRRA